MTPTISASGLVAPAAAIGVLRVVALIAIAAALAAVGAATFRRRNLTLPG